MNDNTICMLFGAMGALFASFANCVAYRLPRHMNWVSGHSVCNNCGRRLAVWELVPIVSCVILRGCCAHCKAYFGLSNAVTELLLCISCMLVYRHADGVVPGALISFAVCCVYCAIAVCLSYFRFSRGSRSK